MKNMKKIGMLFCVLMLAGSALTGCSSSSRKKLTHAISGVLRNALNKDKDDIEKETARTETETETEEFNIVIESEEATTQIEITTEAEIVITQAETETEQETTEIEIVITEAETEPETEQETSAAAASANFDTAFVQGLASAADYLYVDMIPENGKVVNVYYLVPQGDGTYQYTSANGEFTGTISGQNAKQIVDDIFTLNGSYLPNAGGRGVVVWNSPYGLCKYDHQIGEYHGDTSGLKYTLNEGQVQDFLNNELCLPDEMPLPKSKREN